MKDSVTIDVDTTALDAAVVALSKKVDPSSVAAREAIGLEIIRLSSFEVPHDKGTLQNSATVQVIGDDVVAGYHTHYAARLHEHPEYRFQKGRKGHYLSDPIIRNVAALGIQLGKEFEKALGI